MKYAFFVSISILLLASCQKEIRLNSSDVTYLDQVRKVLKDSLSDNDFSKLDFTRARITKNPPASTYYFRIPFKRSLLSQEFVLLKTYTNGTVLSGLIINLQR